MILLTFRKSISSCLDVFCRKGVLRSFQNSQKNTCAQSLFSQKETLAQVFFCEFCKISKNTFFYGTPPGAASRNFRVEIHSIDVMANIQRLNLYFLIYKPTLKCLQDISTTDYYLPINKHKIGKRSQI